MLSIVGLALFITVFIKLPQETWIHVLQFDVTDTLAEHNELVLVLVAFLIVVFVSLLRLVRRSPVPDWTFTMAVTRHQEPRPPLGQITQRLWDPILAEKIVFLSLAGVVLAHMVPELSINNLRLGLSVATLVFLNAAVTEWWFRKRGRDWTSTLTEFLAVLLVNVVLLALVPEILLARGLPEQDSLLLVVMLSLMATMFDRGRDTRPPVDPPAHPFREAQVAWSARRGAARAG